MNRFTKPKLTINIGVTICWTKCSPTPIQRCNMSSLSEVLTRNLSDSFSTSFRQSSYTNIQSIQSLPSYAATVTHQIQEAAQCRCPHSLLQLFSLPNKKQASEIKVEMIFITSCISDCKIGERHPSASTTSYFLWSGKQYWHYKHYFYLNVVTTNSKESFESYIHYRYIKTCIKISMSQYPEFCWNMVEQNPGHRWYTTHYQRGLRLKL